MCAPSVTAAFGSSDQRTSRTTVYDRDDALVRAIHGAALPSDSTIRLAAEVGHIALELTR